MTHSIVSEVLEYVTSDVVLDNSRARVLKRTIRKCPLGKTRFEMDTNWPAGKEHIRTALRTGLRQYERYVVGKSRNREGKSRDIFMASPIDATLTGALAQGLYEKAVAPLLPPCVWGFRRRRSANQAVRWLQEVIKQHRYVTVPDIHRHFPSSRPSQILDRLEAVWPDPLRIGLIRNRYATAAIKKVRTEAGWREREVPVEGLVTGESLSPVLSNFDLLPVDLCLQANSQTYGRFADNFAAANNSLTELRRIRGLMEREVAAAGFTFNPEENKFIDTHAGPVLWLGWMIEAKRIGIPESTFSGASQRLSWYSTREGWSDEKKRARAQDYVRSLMAHFRGAWNYNTLYGLVIEGRKQFPGEGWSVLLPCGAAGIDGRVNMCAPTQTGSIRHPAGSPSGGIPAGVGGTRKPNSIRANSLCWLNFHVTPAGLALIRCFCNDSRPIRANNRLSTLGIVKLIRDFILMYGIIHPADSRIRQRIRHAWCDADDSGILLAAESRRIQIHEAEGLDFKDGRPVLARSVPIQSSSDARALQEILSLNGRSDVVTRGLILETAAFALIASKPEAWAEWPLDLMDQAYTETIDCAALDGIQNITVTADLQRALLSIRRRTQKSWLYDRRGVKAETAQ